MEKEQLKLRLQNLITTCVRRSNHAMQLIEYAKEAAVAAGIVPDVAPIRGGTDGARLSFKGLPCPNLGTGGYAFHGVYEHITVEGMDKAVIMVKDIIGKFTK